MNSVLRSNWKLIAAIGLAGVVASGWYLFRPERAFIDARTNDSAPLEITRVLLSGEFHPEAHKGRGLAQVVLLPNGERMLRLSGFETLNGPDVRLYLLGADDVRSGARLSVAGYVDLGPLKGNVGDQNYLIPADVDLARYRAVSAWCRRFAVNFTMASLALPASPESP